MTRPEETAPDPEVDEIVDVTDDSETPASEPEAEPQDGEPQAPQKPWEKEGYKTPEEVYEAFRKERSEKDKALAKAKEYESKKETKPDEGKEKLSFDEQFEIDREGAVKQAARQVVMEVLGSDMSFLRNQRLQTYMSEAKKVFPDFDFESEDNKKNLEIELSKLSEEFRGEKPVEALVLAIKNIVGDDYKKEKLAAEINKKKQIQSDGKSMKAPKTNVQENEINDILGVAEKHSGPVG